MDPNRHHEFIDSNEERSRAMYFNRGVEDVRPHTQYYPQDRNLMNSKKTCVCTSVAGNNMTCNGCRTSTAEGASWNPERTQQQGREDFRNTSDTRSTLRQSPMYAMPSNISSSRPYWQQNTSSFTEELMPPIIKQIATPQHMDRKMPLPSNKPCTLEQNYSYKQKLPQQAASAIGTYPKEPPYDDKYSIMSSKLGYASTASSAPSALYNTDGHGHITNMESMRTAKADQHVINPSNILASKEQHPSPNYARKCPQMFSPEEQNSTHLNLYMSTPQFSSDKFTNIQHTQQKKSRESSSTSHQEYRGSNSASSSSSVHMHLLPETSKIHESPMLMSSPMPVYSSQGKYMQLSEPTIQQQHVLQQPYTSGSATVPQMRNANYYPQGPSKVHAPEMSPIIMKQTHTPHYQYSTKSPISPPSSSSAHLVTSAKTSMRDIVEYMKKEDDPYDCHGVPTRSLYINPYNTPPSSDSCCKEPSSPYTSVSNYNVESPQAYHHKYGSNKTVQETVNKMSLVNQNTPTATSITSGFRDQTKYYYETTSNLKYDNGNPHSAPSPAAATVASPSPSSSATLSTSQQLQMQHNTEYVPQQPHHSQSYQQHHHQTEIRRSSIRTPHEIYTHHHTDPYDRNNIVAQQSSKITSLNTISKIQQPSATQPPTLQMQTPAVASKKAQMTKPNYRELINQVYAMRNATSEKELNMQIIKKTLNVDTQVMRAPMASVLQVAPPSPASLDKIQRNSSLGSQGITPPPQSNNSREAYRSVEIIPTPLRSQPKCTPSVELQDVRRIIKQEEKPSTSPLDLSMRTVKTKADSTEYKYRRLPATSQSVDCKYALPRVDFTPNFSLHTPERNVINKSVEIVRLDQNDPKIYTPPVLNHHIPSTAYQKLEQPQSSVEPPNLTSMSSRNILSFKSNLKTSAVSTARNVPPPPVCARSELQITSNSLVINTAPKPVILCDLEACQVRPSVLETNPYASSKAIKPEPSLVNRNLLAVDQLPPDTSIMPLPKVTFADRPPQISESIVRRVDHQPPFSPPVKSAYSLACELNPNFLGRKRHLQEYSTLRHTEPVIKQTRLQESMPMPKSEYVRQSEVTVIAVNERVVEMENLKTMKAKNITTSFFPQNNSIIVANNSNMRLCKEEPVTPTTTEVPSLPIAPIKTETNSLIAARIRTKAELKGFTFNPPLIEVFTTPIETLKVKEEPVQNPSIELPSIPDLNEEYSPKSLLDFNWNTTCNDFLEQLLTNKKPPIKMKPSSTTKPEFIVSEDSVPISTIVKTSTTAAATIVFTEAQCNREDSMDHNISNMESAETKSSFGRIEANDSAMTFKSVSQDTVNTQIAIPKKINKLDREKMRLQQEKRFAARLQGATSSETDNDELDKRKRLKKPLLKKVKIRSSKIADKHLFSDCGSDSSSDVDDVVVSGANGNQLNPISRSNEPTDRETVVKRSSKERNNCKKGHMSYKPNPSTQKISNSEVKIRNLKRADEISISKLQEQENKNKTKQVQYAVDTRNNKNKLDKGARKAKLNLRVSLNTMTRSKQKRELELQLANSKVLRNDKIIRNSTTKIKRKYVRKFVGNQNSTGKESLSRDNTGELMSTRLRTKNYKDSTKISKSRNITAKEKNENSEDLKTNRKGKERQADLFMEVYRFKRSLKVPPSLISMKHPTNHKIAASLPDLERDDDHLAITSNRGKKTVAAAALAKSKSPAQIATTFKPQTSLIKEPRSIIDVLHSRVVNSNAGYSFKPTKITTTAAITTANINNSSSMNIHSETSQNTESNSINELFLLPSLKKNDDNGDDDDESNDGGGSVKKRHFSIFDTKVLQSKTRTESKLQQKREIIREIFVGGGDDRPASAPPEMIQILDEGGEKMTYEQKYEQFLQQMNIVISEDKLRKLDRNRASFTVTTATPSTTTPLSSSTVTTAQVSLTIKREEDTESASAIDADEKHDGESQHEHFSSLLSSTMPTNFQVKRRIPKKYLRRKGSSGFDYIRKKKKPTPALGSAAAMQHSHAAAAAALLKTYRTAEEDDEVKIKTESDVCREIQKWVLNKGVGQSTMHKAARLGYIDVIVYCLDRLNMNPDQKDNAGYTPLHEACTNGWLDIARVLLQYGANHSEAAHSGIRPLHEASENDYEEIVRLLLSYGADPLLATYSGQTPLMLASSTAMRDILNNHLSDVQTIGPDRKPWRFQGSWEIFDATECGYDIFWGAPNFTCDMSRALRKSSVSSSMANTKQLNQYGETSSKTVMDKCAVVLDNIDRFNSVRLYNDNKPEFLVENSDSEGEIFEFEEADVLLPPLYLLKDEGTDKWVLLSDLCNLLKVKSKDTLLNKIYPASSVSSAHKSLMRELKMSDFLEKATCLQLLCAGEKINICASKVVLIKYNESVRNLLGVKTILMKF